MGTACSLSTSRLSTWLMMNELENFSAAYAASWMARDCVVFLPESFCACCRLLPEASAPVSIPVTFADRLEDTKVIEDTTAETRINKYPHENTSVLQAVGWESSCPLSSRSSVSGIAWTCPWGPDIPSGAQDALLRLTSTVESMEFQQSGPDWDLS